MADVQLLYVWKRSYRFHIQEGEAVSRVNTETQGVRLVKVDSGSGEKVASVALVAEVDPGAMDDLETPEEGD